MELLESIQSWSYSVGVRIDILKTVIALAVSLLLSPIFRLVRGRFSRNTLSIILGTLLLIFILEEWSLLVFGGMTIPYILMKIFKNHFLIAVICSFFLLLFVHTYRFIFFYNVWQVDCSVFIMLLVTKITYFGKWAQDAGLESKYSFWDYLGYNLYFPGLLAGPIFSFQNYLNFIEDKRKEIEKTTKSFALAPMLFAVPLIALTLYTMPIFHPRWVLQNQFYLSLSFWQKIGILNIVGFLYRAKFYSAWYLAQTATNLSGLSLSPSGEYNQVTTGSLYFEVEPNPKNKTEYWNSSVQQWLKNLVYASLIKKLGPNGAFFGTFIVSAFWHGIYLTYYLGFLQWGILLYLTKWAYKWTLLLPSKLTNSWIFTFLTWIVSATLMNYIGMFIVVLEWQDAVAFYGDIHYYGSILFLALFVLSFIIRAPRQRQQKSHDN